MFQLWMAYRYFKGKKSFFSLNTALSFLGIVLGVAALVLATSVVNGVQSHMRNSVIETTGHMLIFKLGHKMNDFQSLEKELTAQIPEFQSLTPFVHLEGLIVNEGKLFGVIVQGVDQNSVDKVLDFKNRIVEGVYDLSNDTGVASIIVGKEIAKKMNLGIGARVQLILPQPQKNSATNFSPRLQTFQVSGILDMGKYDFNERFIIMSDKNAQKWALLGDEYMGARLQFSSPQAALDSADPVQSLLGYDFRVRTWFDTAHNFFSAVEIEKRVIIFILFFLVLVASFNVSSTLFVDVYRRFSDISILKTLGATDSFLIYLFVLHGSLLGVVGVVLGLALGGLLSFILMKTSWIYVPGEIYKFDHLPVEFRWSDWGMIFLIALGLCLVASVIPAIKGARLKPIEGLRYE